MMLLAQASSQDPSALGAAALAAFGLVYFLVVLACVAFGVFCYYLIAKKAGYNPWLSLLMLVPLANLIVGLIFVFGEWPIIRENRMLRARLGIPPDVPLDVALGGVPPSAPPLGGTIMPT